MAREERSNDRVLVVDDNRAIHEDFAKILRPARRSTELEELEREFLDLVRESPPSFELAFASQGAEALELVVEARRGGRPFATIFLDLQMPPGWDGIETAGYILEADPEIQIVLCTAYSSRSWDEIQALIDGSERVQLVRKPFDTTNIRDLTVSLQASWETARAAGAGSPTSSLR